MDSGNDPTEKRLKEAFDALKQEDRRRLVSFEHLANGGRATAPAGGMRLMPWAVAALVIMLGIGGYMVTVSPGGKAPVTAQVSPGPLPDDLGTEAPPVQIAPQVIALVEPTALNGVEVALEPITWTPTSDVLLADPSNIASVSDRLLADAAL